MLLEKYADLIIMMQSETKIDLLINTSLILRKKHLLILYVFHVAKVNEIRLLFVFNFNRALARTVKSEDPTFGHA